MAINILDSVIANRISAGEVVEKPASIVKELMDNALDAGATEIYIDIINGGIDQISIQDNGCGIEPTDIKKAFLPHATSKISCLEDLDSIATLGFRGEALASISSVAQVTMITKTKDLDYASTISVNGGVFGSVGATASQNGTYIEVRNLFFNTPARRKFLRRPKSEESEITNFISRYILAHPSIKIRYTANEKVIFDNKGGDLLNAIACVYGSEILPHLEPINYESGYLKINGYVGKISYTKPNTTYQTLLVNGRYIIDESVSKAIYSAYEEFLMSRQFPFYVINLDIPYDEVDVNVHPNKMNVKFAHPNEIFDVFYRASRQAIYSSINPISENSTNPNHEEVNYRQTDNDAPIKTVTLREQVFELENSLNKLNIVQEFKQKLNNPEVEVEIMPVEQPLAQQEIKQVVQIEKFVPTKNASIFDNETLKSSEEHPSYQSINNFSDYKIIGELFNEFLILEKNDVMLLIDFHAGHERLIYDKLVSKINAQDIEIQSLLVPYTHQLNVQEMEYISHLTTNLKELGFEIQQIGPNEICILTVPLILSDINLKEFIENLLHDMNNKKPKINNELDRMLMQKACKSAVKSGMTLSLMQIQELLKNLDINNPVLLCPHGRPIVTIVKRSQIEKWFKRIV